MRMSILYFPCLWTFSELNELICNTLVSTYRECHINGLSIAALRRQDTSYPQFLILCKVTSLILERPFHIVRQSSIRHFCLYTLHLSKCARAAFWG